MEKNNMIANIEKTAKPSTQQQIFQCAYGGEYIKYICDVPLFTLYAIYKGEVPLKSYYVNSILHSQFPTNRNMTYVHVFHMKKRIRIMMIMLDGVPNFQYFQQVFRTTNLGSWLDDISL